MGRAVCDLLVEICQDILDLREHFRHVLHTPRRLADVLHHLVLKDLLVVFRWHELLESAQELQRCVTSGREEDCAEGRDVDSF